MVFRGILFVIVVEQYGIKELNVGLVLFPR